MTSWNDVVSTAPELAEMVQGRFEATGLGLLATLRTDGSPRISGIEPSFFDGELLLGMMDGSLKARDLQRDPRIALHNATVDKEVKDGDVKIAGSAVEITDDAAKRAFLAAFVEANGYGPPDDDPMHLFRVDITEVSTVRPATDHLVIQTWKPGQDVRRVERR